MRIAEREKPSLTARRPAPVGQSGGRAPTRPPRPPLALGPRRPGRRRSGDHRVLLHRLDRALRRIDPGGRSAAHDRRGRRRGRRVSRARCSPRPPGRSHRSGRRERATPRRGRPQPAGSRRDRTGRRGLGPAHRRRRRDRRRRPGRRAQRGMGVRDRPREPGVGHGRGYGRDQRGRHPPRALRRHPGPGPRDRGRARDRCGRLPSRRAAQGQHRLPPPRSPLRQRGDAGSGHGRPAAPRPGPRLPDHRAPRVHLGGRGTRRRLDAPALGGGARGRRALLRTGARARLRDLRARAAVRHPASRPPARRGGRTDRSDRRPGRSRRLPRRGGRHPRRGRARTACRTLALSRGPHRGDQHPRGAAQARCHPSRGRARRVRRHRPGYGALDRADRAHLALRPCGRRQRPRERDRGRPWRRPRRRCRLRAGRGPRGQHRARSTGSAPRSVGGSISSAATPRSTRSARSSAHSTPTASSTRTRCCRPRAERCGGRSRRGRRDVPPVSPGHPPRRRSSAR